MEELEARILGGAFGDGDRFEMLGHPSGNALPNPNLQTVDYVRVRILRGPQHKFIFFQNVNEAGIALYQGSGKIDDAAQNIMKTFGGAQPHADFMEYINV